MMDDLEPLDVQRSLSVPISGPKGSVQPSGASPAAFAAVGEKSSLQVGGKGTSLDEDDQLLVVFKLAVWICKLPNDALPRTEKGALLVHAIKAMNILSKRAKSVTPLAQMVQTGSNDLMELCIAVLCLGEQKLLQGLQTLLRSIAEPPALDTISTFLEDLLANAPSDDSHGESTEVRTYLQEERKKHRELLRQWIQQAQGLLIWLIDRRRASSGSESALFASRTVSATSPWTAMLNEKCAASKLSWVEHLSFLLHGYIGYTKALMELEAKLDEHPGQASAASKLKSGLDAGNAQGQGEEDEELVPLKVAKALSLPISRQPHQGVKLSTTEASIQLIKSLMTLLLDQDTVRASDVEGAGSSSTGLGPQLMPQVWTLVLESFQTVSVSKLVEARIVDTLIKAFLRATEEIQQSTFPQILAISEGIAKDKVHSKDSGKLLSNLVFTTLGSVTGNPSLETVGFSVCQGWLDIMICSSVSRPHFVENSLESVHTRMDSVEACALLRKTSKFLRNHLNLGSFEGATGAQQPVVMRLSLACDLLHVVFNVKNKDRDTLALTDLEK